MSTSPITASQFLATVTHGRTTQLVEREQARAAGEAKEAALAELEAATKAKLQVLTRDYATQVRAACDDYRRVWTAYARAHGPTSDYDAATNSRLAPQFLGEALGRMLTAAGLNVSSVSMQRGARQARHRRT